MPKRFIIGLILLLATLVGLYQLRIQLLTTAFNTTLAKTDIRLLQLHGLELGWDAVDIDRLVLGLGEDNAPQTLRGVHLSYSVTELQPHSLVVKHAILAQPANSDGGAGEAPLLLSDILDQVFADTLQSILIEELELVGFSSPLLRPPLGLRAEWENDRFTLQAMDRDKQLHLELSRSEASKQTLTAKLTSFDKPVVELVATITGQGSERHIEGRGHLWGDAAMPILRTFVDLPEAVTAVRGDVLFQVSGQMDDELAKLDRHSWQLQVLPQTEVELELTEPGAEISLHLNFPQPLIVSLQIISAKNLTVSVAGKTIRWQMDEQLNNVKVSGELSDIDCRYHVALGCSTALALELTSPLITLAGDQPVVVRNLLLQLSGQLNLDEHHVSAVLDAGQWLHAESLAQDDIDVIGPALTAQSAGIMEYGLSTGEVKLAIAEFQIGLPQVQLPDFNLVTLLNIQDMELSRDAGGAFTASVGLSAEAINLQRPGTWLPALSIDSQLQLSGQRISLTGDVRGSGHKPLFNITAGYQMDAERGSVRILSEGKTFNDEGNRLSQHFAHWPFDWDIFDGSVMLDLGLYWKMGEQGTEIQGEIRQQTQALAGVYQDIGFVGLNTELTAQFQSLDEFTTTKPAIISLASLDVGVPIEAIEVRFLLDSVRQELKIESAEARVFEGRVWIDDAVYRSERAHNPIFVGVDGLQLDRLLELAGYDAVKGTGTISGLLPLDVNNAGLTMKRGMLAAKAPGGVFSYQSEVAAGTSPAMVQVIEALNNYHYSVFQVEADYLENGDLVLAMILRGSNPDLQQGRPIHLNLNVTDNIPTLLKSLQPGRVIADTVSRKLGGNAK